MSKTHYKGVYPHWSKKHLPRYLNEFIFRLD
ncbi:MAG: transposase [Bdellovibrionales bacterium]|nr:transposase [Bdellovibrionales bacterium]